MPGSTREVSKQFLRCVLIKLAPNGIFSELFRSRLKGNDLLPLNFFSFKTAVSSLVPLRPFSGHHAAPPLTTKGLFTWRWGSPGSLSGVPHLHVNSPKSRMGLHEGSIFEVRGTIIFTIEWYIFAPFWRSYASKSCGYSFERFFILWSDVSSSILIGGRWS